MKCANCASAALYEYKVTYDVSQFYCGKHCPKFLDARRRAGTLAITTFHNDEKESALAILGVKQPKLEPEPVPEPKPVRKRKPKNATNS